MDYVIEDEEKLRLDYLSPDEIQLLAMLRKH
jgi:hypothetical protein